MGRFSKTLRSGVLVGVGAALILMPLPLGLSAAAAVTGLAAGTIAIALGLAGTAPYGRGTLPLSAQGLYDRMLALGLLIAGVVFGLGEQDSALVFFGAGGVLTLTVAIAAGYRPRPA